MLQVVKILHEYLRESTRKSDTITSKVLDLVDQHLLCPNPRSRIGAPELCQNFDQILSDNRIKEQKPLDSLLREAFDAVEAHASEFAVDSAPLLTPAHLAHEERSSESSRLKRSHYTQRPIKKTTYRAENLDMKSSTVEPLLSIQEPGQMATPPSTPAKSAVEQIKSIFTEQQRSQISNRSSRPQSHYEPSPTGNRARSSFLQQHNEASYSFPTKPSRRKHATQDTFTAREEAEKERKNRSFLKRHAQGDAKL